MKEWLLLFHVTQINKKRVVVKMSRFLISQNWCFSLFVDKKTKRGFFTNFQFNKKSYVDQKSCLWISHNCCFRFDLNKKTKRVFFRNFQVTCQRVCRLPSTTWCPILTCTLATEEGSSNSEIFITATRLSFQTSNSTWQNILKIGLEI